MNKNTLKILSLLVGIFSGISALLYLVLGIMELTNLNFDYDARYNILMILLAIVSFATAVGLGFFSYKLIKLYLNKEEKSLLNLMPGAIYFLSSVVSLLISICFGAYANVSAWIMLILYGAGLVFSFMVLFSNLEEKTKAVFTIVASGIGFVLSVVDLAQSGGIGIAIDIFLMFMFIAMGLYFVFEFVMKNPELVSSKKEDNKEENKEENNDNKEE